MSRSNIPRWKLDPLRLSKFQSILLLRLELSTFAISRYHGGLTGQVQLTDNLEGRQRTLAKKTGLSIKTLSIETFPRSLVVLGHAFSLSLDIYSQVSIQSSIIIPRIDKILFHSMNFSCVDISFYYIYILLNVEYSICQRFWITIIF